MNVLTGEELAALRAMPIWLDPGGTLPPGAPKAPVLNRLHARGLIQLHNGHRHRWALTMQGQAELARWTRR